MDSKLMSRRMMPHTYQEGMKRCTTWIIRILGKRRAFSHVDSNMAWASKKRICLGVLWSSGGAAGVKVPAWARAWVVWTSHSLQRKVHRSLLTKLPRCGAEGKEGGVRLKRCQQLNIKIWVRLCLHMLLQCDYAALLIEKWYLFLHPLNLGWTNDLFGQYSLAEGTWQIPSPDLKRFCMLLLSLRILPPHVNSLFQPAQHRGESPLTPGKAILDKPVVNWFQTCKNPAKINRATHLTPSGPQICD